MANTDIYEVPDEAVEPVESVQTDPLYQIYDGAKVLVSKNVGPYWRSRYEAGTKAYEAIHEAWDDVFRYYNNSQGKSLDTPRGVFKRGDSTENIVYSNLNTMLPAVYSKDPDIQCNTIDNADEPFCDTMKAVINTLLKRRDKLHAKPKIKRAAGLGLLTNQGVLKLNWTFKDDSREYAAQELQRITKELSKASNKQDVDRLYGELQALEQNMEVFESSGPSLKVVLPHRLLIDPYAEDSDGLDGNWMMEELYYNTAALNARFTEKKTEDGETEKVLRYKPTHKAVFADGQGDRDDGLGLVFNELDKTVNVESHTEQERLAYMHSYYTRCILVWDKVFRRVYLFHADDWQYPIWVWEDPYKLSRFFPYFLIGYGMSTGGATSVGEPSYILDQQDEINDINRQVARMRRQIFDVWLYNTEAITKDEAEKFVKIINGQVTGVPKILGVRPGENRKASEMFEPLLPPSAQAEAFFNKEPILASINRITNTSDAIKGVQFKAGTTEDAVQTYQDAARLSIGAKVDVVEDAVSDLSYALAELAIQHLTKEDVAGLVGNAHAANWRDDLSLEEFRSTYSLEVVAGSMEKANSVFKKKEAVQIAQSVGQFAQAAPGATLKIMLKVLSKAFTEVNIQKEDWDAIDQEVSATLSKGVSTGGTEEPAAGAGEPNQVLELAKQLPPEVKQEIMQMREQGVPDDQIAKFIQTQVAQMQQGGQNAQPTQ